MPATTPCVNLPYPVGTDRLRIQADIQTLAEAIDLLLCEGIWQPGDIKATVAATAGPGWLMLDGSTHATADTLYPDLWAVAPAAWKSGTSLILPNMASRTLMGGGTLGLIGGANSRSLSVANLPAHHHPMPHVHNIVHDHKNTRTESDGYHDHAHTYSTTEGNSNGTMRRGTIDSSDNYPEGSANGVIYGGAHTHVFDVPSFNGNSQQPNNDDTGNTGSGSPLDTTPSNMRVNYVVKT